jgi:hypothetical protein
MAKQLVPEANYSFDATGGVVTLIDGGDFTKPTATEQILIVTNVSDQIIIYLPQEIGFGGTYNPTTGELNLDYDTTSPIAMGNSDPLQIFVDSQVGCSVDVNLIQDHNGLDNIQGGSVNERYHLTQTQESQLTGGANTTLHFHDADRARANHTGTQLANTISNFQTQVSANTDVTANTNHRNTTGNPHGLLLQDLIPIQASPPGSPVAGDLFVRNTDHRLFAYNGTKWLDVSTEREGSGRNATGVSNSFLRGYNGAPTNLSPILIPEDITIVGVSLLSNNAVTWSALILPTTGTTPIYTLASGGANQAIDNAVNVDVASGQRLRVYCLGTGVNYPRIDIMYRRRAT